MKSFLTPRKLGGKKQQIMMKTTVFFFFFFFNTFDGMRLTLFISLKDYYAGRQYSCSL